MQRVLIYRLGSLGDTVVALPCLHRVAAAYPHAERMVLTNFPVSTKAAPIEAILDGSGLVHGYLTYPVGTRSLRRLASLRRELRAAGADTLVYLTPARGLVAAWRDLLYFRLCGFRRIVGLPLSSDLQRHRRGADGLLERECERLARCMAPLGQVPLSDPASWDLRLTVAEKQAAAVALAPVAGVPRIVVNMGGKVARNDWGVPNWQALAERLRGMCADHALVFVGGAEDAPRADDLVARWPGPALQLCGRLSPRTSAAAMAGARLFVGHDSGPLHLAACMGVPCVGLYGDNHEPRKWHPWGDRHRILHDMRGVQSIRVDDVASAVSTLLRVTDEAVAEPQPVLTGASP